MGFVPSYCFVATLQMSWSTVMSAAQAETIDSQKRGFYSLNQSVNSSVSTDTLNLSLIFLSTLFSHCDSWPVWRHRLAADMSVYGCLRSFSSKGQHHMQCFGGWKSPLLNLIMKSQWCPNDSLLLSPFMIQNNMKLCQKYHILQLGRILHMAISVWLIWNRSLLV